jgi:acyl-CoA reductase-like NAD-dependent aldehyde dehydrogenase
VQRVLVHKAVAQQLRDELLAACEAFPTGDPAAEGVMCGPVISTADADRIGEWVREAEAAGARLLTPIRRDQAVVSPLLVDRAPVDARVWSDEAFAPVAALAEYDTFEQALAMVNDSRFGLQAGIFTNDIGKLQRAFDEIEVGGIIQGDIPSWRADPMPYGGVKSSGIGREGPRFAVEEMTEPRLLVLRRS